jgi:RimJ/RimL family protein N-acetyltransferase
VVKKVAFDDLGAHRLWLDVKQRNARAQALYESEGFVLEGVLRESVRVQGGFESMMVLSMLESEFAQRRGAALELAA